MYKDKSKQKEAGRERSRRYREAQKALQGVTEDIGKGVTPEGVTAQGVTLEDITQEGVTEDVQDLLDKLTDPVWRDKLGRICDSLGRNRDAVWLGNFKLSLVSDLLTITSPR